MNNIEKAVELKNQRIKKAINHRDKGIGFWASMNNAVNYSGGKKPLEEVFKDAEKIYEYWQEWYVSNYDLEDEGEEKAF